MKSNISDSNDALKLSNRNTLAFWIIVWLIGVLTIGNLALTLTIYGVLRLGRGMEYLEVRFKCLFQYIIPLILSNVFMIYYGLFSVQLVPESDAVKFFESIDMDKIDKKNGLIEGFFNRPVIITGNICIAFLFGLHLNENKPFWLIYRRTW